MHTRISMVYNYLKKHEDVEPLTLSDPQMWFRIIINLSHAFKTLSIL